MRFQFSFLTENTIKIYWPWPSKQVKIVTHSLRVVTLNRDSFLMSACYVKTQFKNSCNVFKRTASQIKHHHQVPFCAVHLSARCLAADLFVYRGGEVRPSFPTPACLCFSCLASAPLWPPPRLEATQPPPTCQASNCTLPLHMHQVYARPFFNTCTENTCIDQG